MEIGSANVKISLFVILMNAGPHCTFTSLSVSLAVQNWHLLGYNSAPRLKFICVRAKEDEESDRDGDRNQTNGTSSVKSRNFASIDRGRGLEVSVDI